MVDLDTHKLVGLVPERKQSEIEKVMQKWGEQVLAEIEEVSIDMSGNYKSLVKKLCPNAEVTVDRFHVTKMVHEELNQARVDQKKTAEPYYKKSVKTIKRWLTEIVGYFERRTTNGIVEGINNKLKVLKRCGFGFRNFINFETRALPVCLTKEVKS